MKDATSPKGSAPMCRNTHVCEVMRYAIYNLDKFFLKEITQFNDG